MEDLPNSQEELQNMLGSLSDELEKIEEKKKAVMSALLKKAEPTVQKPTVQDIIIVFVEEIEKANQYFEFELYLKEHDVVKPKHDAVKNLRNLVEVLKVQENPRFNKLDFKQIMNAVQSYILDWKKQNRQKKSIQGNTSCEVSSEEGYDWYSLMSLKGHVMDENPLVELGYIEKFDHLCYKSCIFWRLLQKRSEREVTAFCIPDDYDPEHVKKAFSVCGNVVSVKLERQGKTANVIFENSVAAKLAPIILARTLNYYVTPALEKYEYQPKAITEYEAALITYNKFRNYSEKSQIEPVQT